MYYVGIALLFVVACSFPAALITAIRSEDQEKAAASKLWACISFGIIMLFVL